MRVEANKRNFKGNQVIMWSQWKHYHMLGERAKERKQCFSLAPPPLILYLSDIRPRALKSVELWMLPKFGKLIIISRIFRRSGTYTSWNSFGPIVILHLSLKDSGAQILDARSVWLLSSLEWHPLCMGPQFGTWFIPFILHPEFWGGFRFLKHLCTSGICSWLLLKYCTYPHILDIASTAIFQWKR
jgi:hypothetical protein